MAGPTIDEYLAALPADVAAEAERYRGAKDAMHLKHSEPLPTALLEQVLRALAARAALSP